MDFLYHLFIYYPYLWLLLWSGYEIIPSLSKSKLKKKTDGNPHKVEKINHIAAGSKSKSSTLKTQHMRKC